MFPLRAQKGSSDGGGKLLKMWKICLSNKKLSFLHVFIGNGRAREWLEGVIDFVVTSSTFFPCSAHLSRSFKVNETKRFDFLLFIRLILFRILITSQISWYAWWYMQISMRFNDGFFSSFYEFRREICVSIFQFSCRHLHKRFNAITRSEIHKITVDLTL